MKLIRSRREDFWDGTLNSQKSAFTEWSLQDFQSLASRRYLTTCSQAQWRGLLTGGDLGLISTETVPKAVSKWDPQRCCLINTPISSGPPEHWSHRRQLAVQAQGLIPRALRQCVPVSQGTSLFRRRDTCWTAEDPGENLLVSLLVCGLGQLTGSCTLSVPSCRW